MKRKFGATLVAALAAAIVSLTLPSPSAFAQTAPAAPTVAAPSPPPPAPSAAGVAGVTFSLGFTDLGLGSSITLAGITATQTITLPVPAGLNPAVIAGEIGVSLDTPGATVDFSSGSDSLLRLQVTDAAPTPFIVPLATVPVHDGLIAVTVTSYVPFPDVYCRGQYDIPMVTLDQLTVGYSGSATAPTTVAGFFPPILGLVRLWIPEAPTPAQLQAASDLTSAIVAINPNRRMALEVHGLPVRGLPDPGPFVPNVRDITIGTTGPSSASVAAGPPGEPILVLTGDGPNLELTESVVVSELSGLLQASRATVGGVFVPAVIPQSEQTVTQLGAGILEVSGEGRLHLDVPFSQGQFGGMINKLTLHLKGTYTPVPAGSTADLSVLVNNQEVAARTLNGSGHFNLQLPVPIAAIQRDNLLIVELAYTPLQGICAAGAVPFDLRIDPSSSIQTHLGPSLPLGFDRLPQALLPGFDLAVDQLNLARASAALRLITAICELSGEQLQARVVPLATEAMSTRPALVLAAAGAVPVGLHPTVDLDNAGSMVVIDQRGDQVKASTLGALAEVFDQNGRTVSLVSWKSLGALNTLVGDLASPDTGLADLTTDVVVLSANGSLVQVPVAATLNPAPPTSSAPALPWWAWPTIAAVPIAVGAELLRRRVRRRRSG